MKPSFPPWLPYAMLIVLAAGLYAYLERDAASRLAFAGAPAHYGMPANGIVRSLRGDAPAVATVVLRDGETIEGRIAPGCFVQIGDRVFVSDSDAQGKRLVFSVPH